MKNQRNENSKKKPSPKGKRKLEFIKEKKKTKNALFGKRIFLDMKEARVKRRLEEDIQRLGATVEAFLCKEINYLITANPPAKQQGKNDDKFGSPESPSMSTPSPFNLGPSPSPSNPEGQKKPAETVSRGKAIYHKAKIATQNNIVVENAQKWGVKIVGLEVAQKWIQKEVSKLPSDLKKDKKGSSSKGTFKVKKLKAPFVKFEDLSNQYKVVYQHLETWPHVNVDTPKGTCPFDGTRVARDDESFVDRRDKIGLPNIEIHSDDEERESDTVQEGKGEKKNSASIIGPVRIVTAGEIRRRAERKKLQEKKRGYCECCQIKYENLDQHIRDDQHKSFVRNKTNYESLDLLIKTGTNCNTAKFLQRTLTSHLKKGKQSCEDVDVTIPESKQWTPRKSLNMKMLMKHQRQGHVKEVKIDDKKRNILSTEKLDVQMQSNSLKVVEGHNKPSNPDCEMCTKLEKEQSSSKRIEDELVMPCQSVCDEQKDPPSQKSYLVSNIGTETPKDVVKKLDQMTIDSPVQINLSGLNLNNSGCETNGNFKTDDIQNTSKDDQPEHKVERKIDRRSAKNGNLVCKKVTNKMEISVVCDSVKNICCDDSNNIRSNKDIELSSRKKSVQNGTVAVNTTCRNPDEMVGSENVNSDNIMLREMEAEQMDMQKHYVPKVTKTYFMEQTMSPNRVNWGEGEVNSGKTKGEKIVTKKWSQKLASKTVLNAEKKEEKNVDEMDITCNDDLSEGGGEICKVKNNAEMSDLKANLVVLNELTKKYCRDEAGTVKINIRKLSTFSKQRVLSKSPVLGKSPLEKSKKRLNLLEKDVYEFNDSPEKSIDVYDLDNISEVNLIGSESPNLSRKKKRYTPRKNSSFSVENLKVSSPKSGVSQTPRSARRKEWRKKNLAPNSDSRLLSKKKLNKFKLPENSSEIEIATGIGSVPEKDHKCAGVLVKTNSKGQMSLSDSEENSTMAKKKSPSRNKSIRVVVNNSNAELAKDEDKNGRGFSDSNKSSPKGKKMTNTFEINAGLVLLPNSVQQVINERNCQSSPLHNSGKFIAIKRLSPSKPFHPEKMKDVDSGVNILETTPAKVLSKPSGKDSGKGSSKKKSPVKKLVWRTAKVESNKSKKVKLNTSISLLSDRSVGKLLASEDNNEQFEGFSQEDVSAESSLDSDASFVETNEIDLEENSHQEWVMDAEMMALNEDSNDIKNLMPDFTSPGKRSDSSWGEACEDYIQSQLSFNASLAKIDCTSPSSPRKVPFPLVNVCSPMKRKRFSSIEEEHSLFHNEKVLNTPKRKRRKIKLSCNGIETVDSEIEFNHLSPQKVAAMILSPVKNFPEETILSSSPLKNVKQTSTPFRGDFKSTSPTRSRRSKYKTSKEPLNSSEKYRNLQDKLESEKTRNKSRTRKTK